MIRKPIPKTDISSQAFAALPITVQEFSELVGAIYQGQLDPVPWATLLGLLHRHLQANWVTLILRPASKNQPALTIRDGGQGAEIYDAAYNDYQAFSLDPFVGLPPNRVITIDEMIDTEQWIQSSFYKMFIEPNHIRYILGTDIRAEDGTECRVRVTRPPTGKDFSPAEKSLCQTMLVHFNRALSLHSRLEATETERGIYATAMDHMLVGTVILDETGAVMRCNSIAAAMLAEKDGICITQGRIHINGTHEDRELQRLIKRALAMRVGIPVVPDAYSLPRSSSETRLEILIRPISFGERSEGSHRPAVALFIRDPERKLQPSYELVKQLFELTPAEAKLATLLANGMTLDEAADELGVRKNTTRAHLRSIFVKTGATRQTTLVRLMLSSVANFS